MSEFKTNKISPRKGTTQTIGDSGDTLSIPCGVTVTNAGTISTAGISGGTINNTTGTISGLRGQVEWDTTAKTTAFTAVSNKGYFCNTTSASFIVTLPASPTVGDVISLKDYANTFDTNNLTLNPNGNKIQGTTSNFTISVEGANSQFIYVDTTRGWVLTDASKASDIAEAASFITATGGTETTCGDFKIHTFTGPGTFTVSSLANGPTNPLGGPNNVDYLVVAGGGGGGPYTGGGGAGGHRTTFPSPGCNAGTFPVTATTFPITVGSGGAADNSGSNSVFSTITSTGGGKGGSFGCAGASGGSGGGGGNNEGPPCTSNPGGAGNTPPVSPSQGNPGGSGNNNPGSGPYGQRHGGGGGGAAGSGGNGNTSNSGPGGNGVANSITGSSVTRAGGGGGSRDFRCATGSSGSGGTGGGGAGQNSGGPSGGFGENGTANTGGGGGGGGFPGPNAGTGGSGIVIIRYKYQ